MSIRTTTRRRPDRWAVPTTTIGPVTVPRLWLGDHGFLRRYGSRLTLRQIVDRMSHAVKHASVALCGGDSRCLRSARCAAGTTGPVVYHSDLCLAIGARRAHFGRCMSTLRHLLQESGVELSRDPIMGPFLTGFSRFRRYPPGDCEGLSITPVWWAEEEARIRRHAPTIVTLGGDSLDFACAAAPTEMIESALHRYRELCRSHGATLMLTTYTGPVTLHGHIVSSTCHGVLLPLNSEGMGMVPNREAALDWAISTRKPIVAMHVLGIGRLPVAAGLRWVFSLDRVAGAVVGASRRAHIDALIDAGRQVVGA